jgi:hypothetical protein
MREQKDPNAARLAIFNPTGKTFLYSHKALYRYSDEFNRTVGHISTGDRNEDMKLMNEDVHVGGSIEDILKLFRDGVNVTLRYPKDFAEIYDLIVQHMNNWIEYINHDPNVKNAPMESLTLMEEFANAIYEQALGYRPSLASPPKMKQRRTLLFGGMSREQQVAVPTTTEVTKHVPLLERMEQLLASRNDGQPQRVRT